MILASFVRTHAGFLPLSLNIYFCFLHFSYWLLYVNDFVYIRDRSLPCLTADYGVNKSQRGVKRTYMGKMGYTVIHYF